MMSVQKKNIRNKHTLDVKIEALRILSINDFNYSFTEKQVGITRKTLKKWQAELGENPVIYSKQSQEIANIASQVVGERVDVLKKVEEVSLKALNAAMNILEKETNLDKITNLITALNEISNNNGGAYSPGSNKSMTITERLERITQINHE